MEDCTKRTISTDKLTFSMIEAVVFTAESLYQEKAFFRVKMFSLCGVLHWRDIHRAGFGVIMVQLSLPQDGFCVNLVTPK